MRQKTVHQLYAGAAGKRFDLYPYLMVLPAAVVLAAFIAYPILFNITISFFDYTFTKIARPFVMFRNYSRIIESGVFFRSFVISMTWTAVNLVLMSVLGFTAALILRSKILGSGLLKVFLLVPWVLPQVVTGFTWGFMLTQDLGIINEILYRLNIVERQFSWFQSGRMAFWAVVIANTWRGFPFFSLMIYAKLQTIPMDLIEAARIDGANSFQIFRYIMLEFVKPVFRVCLVLGFLWTFNAFDIITIMTNGGPREQTLTLPLLVQREAFQYLQISRAATMSVMMFLSVILIFSAAYLIMHLFKQKERV